MPDRRFLSRIVVGILAIVAVVAWLVLRGDDAQSPPNPPPPAGSGDLTRRDKIAAPEPPKLPSPESTAPALPPSQGPTAQDRFDEEARDTTWASKTEAELAQRWKKIRGGKIEGTECRQSQCRITVVGSETDVGATVADLEGPRGLHGYAQSVMLTRPERKADGTVSLNIFVVFDR